MRYIPAALLVVLIQLSSLCLAAQQDKQMFMFQVDGNNYTKKSYDKKGELKSSQIFEVGEVKIEEDLATMSLKVISYDKNNKLKGSSETEYTCKPSESEIFMSVFPFADFSSNKTVKIELESGSAFYPDVWKTGDEIADISFSLLLEGGVLGAFGTSSEVRIYDRKITAYDTLNNAYTITSTMQVKAYMFGLRIDTIEFTSEETVNPEKGIIKQYFKETTGEYFTVILTEK